MEIRLPSTLLPTQLSPKSISNLIAQLKPGQNLIAIVETQLAENNFLLRLTDNGQALRARSQLPLLPGQVLKLEVMKLGPTPELRILPQLADEAPETQTIHQAFREFLPKQVSLKDFTVGLKQALSEPTEGTAKSLPEPVRQAVRAILDSLPSQPRLATPEGVKQAVRDSGIFLESKLANRPEDAKALLTGDFKAKLLSLLDRLTTAAPEVGRSVASPQAAEIASANAPADSAEPPAASLPKPTPGSPQALTTETDPETGLPTPLKPVESEPPATKPVALQTPNEGKPTGTATRDSGQAILVELIESAAGDDSPEPAPPASSESTQAQKPAPNPTLQASGPDTRETQKAGASAPATAADPAPSAMATVKPAQEPPREGTRSDLAVPDAVRTPEFKELLQKSEGALAKLVLDQLASLPQADGKQIAWHLDIPFTQGQEPGSAHLKIVREDRPQAPEGEQAFWSVVLELDPPGLGTVHSRITLVGERIDTYFWTDLAATCGLIGEHLDLLSARFQQAGLEVGQVAALPGGAPEDSPGRKATPLTSLVDEKA